MSAAGEGPWRCRHSGAGSFDETARRVSHAELAVAELLAREGHHVRSLPEARGQGRMPDFLVCGVTVEAKCFESLAQRGGRPPTAASVANRIIDASGQGALVVLSGRDSGLSEAAVKSGYLLFRDQALARGLGRLRWVRAVGEGFDISFDLVADLRAAWQARRSSPSAAVGVGPAGAPRGGYGRRPLQAGPAPGAGGATVQPKAGLAKAKAGAKKEALAGKALAAGAKAVPARSVPRLRPPATRPLGRGPLGPRTLRP